MSRGDGGGVSIRFGFHGLPVSGEKRGKLTQPTEIDCHKKKGQRDAARDKVEKPKKRPGPSTAEKKADKKARQHYREAPKEVIVVERVGGEIKAVRTIKRS